MTWKIPIVFGEYWKMPIWRGRCYSERKDTVAIGSTRWEIYCWGCGFQGVYERTLFPSYLGQAQFVPFWTGSSLFSFGCSEWEIELKIPSGNWVNIYLVKAVPSADVAAALKDWRTGAFMDYKLQRDISASNYIVVQKMTPCVAQDLWKILSLSLSTTRGIFRHRYFRFFAEYLVEWTFVGFERNIRNIALPITGLRI